MDRKQLGLGLMTAAIGVAELIEARKAEHHEAVPPAEARILLEAAILAAPIIAKSRWGDEAHDIVDLVATGAMVVVSPRNRWGLLAVAGLLGAVAIELATKARQEALPAPAMTLTDARS